MGYDSLIAHYNKNELSYSLRMFFIGVANHVHWEVMLSFTGFLFKTHGEIEAYTVFKVINYGFVTLATVANARNMLIIQHVQRVDVTAKMFICSYPFFIAAYIFARMRFSMTLATIAVIIQSFAFVYGQCAILGYFKGIPQELIPSYVLGRMIADIIGVLARLTMQNFTIDAIKYYFILGFMICPYLDSFKWIDKNRMQHKQHINNFRVKKFKAAATINLDEMSLPELERQKFSDPSNERTVPVAPGIGDLLAPSSDIKYLERVDGQELGESPQQQMQ